MQAGLERKQNAVTTMDIRLRAGCDNDVRAPRRPPMLACSRWLPKGFALDATRHPHVTMLQQLVSTADLDKVYAAANKVFASEKPTSWKLRAFKILSVPSPPVGLRYCRRANGRLPRPERKLNTSTPFTVKRARPQHYMSTEDGHNIQPFLIEYVANFVKIAAGQRFNPRVTNRDWHQNLPEHDACRAVRSIPRQRRRRSINLAVSLRPKDLKALELDALVRRPREKTGPRTPDEGIDTSVER